MPRGAEASSLHLAGLAEGDNGGAGPRLGHDYAHGRSYGVGKLGTFVLWCLGRRRRRFDPDQEHPAQDE